MLQNELVRDYMQQLKCTELSERIWTGRAHHDWSMMTAANAMPHEAMMRDADGMRGVNGVMHAPYFTSNRRMVSDGALLYLRMTIFRPGFLASPCTMKNIPGRLDLQGTPMRGVESCHKNCCIVLDVRCATGSWAK